MDSIKLTNLSSNTNLMEMPVNEIILKSKALKENAWLYVEYVFIILLLDFINNSLYIIAIGSF